MLWQLNPKLQLMLTPANWAAICTANSQINGQIQYRTDIELYNKPDFWTLADKYGDCDDYAVTKRHVLISLGCPKACLRLAVCKVETGEMHAVLLVETDRGTYTLDNRHKNVLYFKDLPYQWIMIQQQNNTWWDKVK